MIIKNNRKPKNKNKTEGMKLENKETKEKGAMKPKAEKIGGSKESGSKNAGFNIMPPASACNDAKCPFHGDLKVRGRAFTSIVFSSKAQKTATVGWERMHYIPKYERYERRRTKLQAHNPPCINAQGGDIVKIMECRPLSKTKHFVIVEKLGKKELKKPEEAAERKEEKREQEKAARQKGK